MDPILAALVAGATAAASGVASDALKDAYAGLKAVLSDGYKFLSTQLLEKNPTSQAYQEAVSDELKATPAVAEDGAVLEKVEAVQNALISEPPAQLSAWGIDVKQIEAGRDIVIERIKGTGGGLKADRMDAGQDVKLSDIEGGGASSQKP